MSSYNPTYRERTTAFRDLRTNFVKDRAIIIPSSNRLPSNENDPSLPILVNNDNNDVTTINIQPIWLQCVEVIDDNLNKIQQQIGELKEYQTLRQRVMFDDNKANEYDINIQETSHSITSLLKLSKIKLQEIATKGNEFNDIGFEERNARYNAMRSKAIKLQQFTKLFRNTQRQFIENMQIKENKSQKYMNNIDIRNMPDLSNISEGYNQEQIKMIEDMENRANDKTQRILEIAKSVHELAELFNDLSVLIVEQGSLLDRIDYNVEQTLETLENTVDVIKDTDDIQKRSKSALCIIVLVMLIILMALILLLKNTI